MVTPSLVAPKSGSPRNSGTASNRAKAVVWFGDGTERFRSEKSVPHVKMCVLVKLAVGGDWPGAPDETTQLPAAFEVDYLRVYERVR
jgi:beta-glucanase (GH16 family)